MIASKDNLSNPDAATFTPPMQTSLLCAVKHGWHADVKIAEFPSACVCAEMLLAEFLAECALLLIQGSTMVCASRIHTDTGSCAVS